MQKRAPKETANAFVASAFLGALAGVVAYLMIWTIAEFNPTPSSTLHEKLAIFPLLAGIFLRVFFERLKDVFMRMFDWITSHFPGGKGVKKGSGGEKEALLLLTLLLLATPAKAQLITYYVCLNPEEPRRIATSKENQAQYPDCHKWKAAIINTAALEQQALHEQQLAGVRKSRVQSNYFIAAAVAATAAPEMADVAPPSTAVIFADPDSHGLRELKPDESKLGAIAVFDGKFAGVVVEQSDKGFKVAYPSDRHDGKIKIEDASVLYENAVKVLVPEAAEKPERPRP
jgi:hypothetical protein